MSKKDINDKNKEKKLNINIQSKVSSLMIKIYDEHIIRYYGTPAENDKMAAYVKRIFELSKELTEVREKLKNASDTDKPQLESRESELTVLTDREKEDKVLYSSSLCVEKNYYLKFFENLKSIDKSEFEIYAILHDKDTQTDDFFSFHRDIQHIHIGVRTVKTYEKTLPRPKRFIVKDMLDMLHIVFDEEYDKTLLDNDAIAVVRDFSRYIYYLTHEDDNSRLDGKYPYDRSEIIKNVDDERYLATIRGIKRITKRVVEIKDIADIRQDMVEFVAKEGGSVDTMLKTFMPEAVDYCKSQSSINRIVHDIYNEGAMLFVASKPPINKHCIYIYGEFDSGKSYAVEHVFKDLGYKPSECFFGGGRDKSTFAGLKVNHRCALFDDVPLSDVLKVMDDRPTFVDVKYGNTIANIELLIMIQNRPPEKYFPDYNGDEATQNACLSRTAVYKVDKDGRFILERAMSRGTRTNRGYEDREYCNDIVQKIEKYTSSYCVVPRSSQQYLTDIRIKNKEMELDIVHMANKVDSFVPTKESDLYINKCDFLPYNLTKNDFIKFVDGYCQDTGRSYRQAKALWQITIQLMYSPIESSTLARNLFRKYVS